MKYARENAIARKAIEGYVEALVAELGSLEAFLRELRGTHVHSSIVADRESGNWRMAIKLTIEIDDSAEAIRDAFERNQLG